MKKITNYTYTYKAFDGKIFNTKKACIEYEKSISNETNIGHIIDALKRTKDICKNFTCADCPINIFNNGCPIESSVPEKWVFADDDDDE